MRQALLIVLALYSGAATANEAEIRSRLCAGMAQEETVGNGARVDCLTGTLAIEVDFSEKWAEAIGQALYYAAETGREPGIILICRKSGTACLAHGYRAEAVFAHYGLPATIWHCGINSRSLSDCLMKALNPHGGDGGS